MWVRGIFRSNWLRELTCSAWFWFCLPCLSHVRRSSVSFSVCQQDINYAPPRGPPALSGSLIVNYAPLCWRRGCWALSIPLTRSDFLPPVHASSLFCGAPLTGLGPLDHITTTTTTVACVKFMIYFFFFIPGPAWRRDRDGFLRPGPGTSLGTLSCQSASASAPQGRGVGGDVCESSSVGRCHSSSSRTPGLRAGGAGANEDERDGCGYCSESAAAAAVCLHFFLVVQGFSFFFFFFSRVVAASPLLFFRQIFLYRISA